MTNEQIAHFFERIACFFAKNEQFAQKPICKFPALGPWKVMDKDHLKVMGKVSGMLRMIEGQEISH